MIRKISVALLTVISVLSCSSSAKLNSKEAVRQAVIDHLTSRKGLDLDMNAMELDVGDVSFRANDADATVSFRPKGSQTAAMTMKYSLIREGDRWKVKSAGGNAHGVAAPPPAGGAELPPGHPPLGGKK